MPNNSKCLTIYKIENFNVGLHTCGSVRTKEERKRPLNDKDDTESNTFTHQTRGNKFKLAKKK